MEHKLTVTLPDEIYQPLVEAAAQQGRTPEEFAAERLAHAVPPARPPLDSAAAQVAHARLMQHVGAWSSGNPNSADNEQIDADLAREYGNTHEDE
ncbi:MAG: hypothetical protein ACRD9R_16205 [Pyrinomonadaceae bacterium]